MPFLISKGDTKDREGEIRDLKCRIERCGVVLLKKADKTPIADDTNANASPTLMRGKTRTSLVSKKALQEQIKVTHELRYKILHFCFSSFIFGLW